MVLIVEMLGATSTILYGLNIILDPVHEKLEMEADNPGITKVNPADSLTQLAMSDRPLWHTISAQCQLVFNIHSTV